MLLARHPRQRRVAPLARKRVVPVQHLAVHDDATPGTGAEDRTEYDLRAFRRAIDRFGKGEAIRVVCEPHFASELRLEVELQAPAVEGRVVRIEYPAAPRRDRAGHAYADRSC